MRIIGVDVMKTWLTALCFLIYFVATSSAQASFVQHCQFKGKVVSVPKTTRLYFLNEQGIEVEREDTTFQFKIDEDVGCGHQKGAVIPVILNGGYSEVKQIKNNQSLTLNYMVKDGSGIPRWASFWLPNVIGMQPEPNKYLIK